MPAEENLKEGVSSTCEPFGKEGVVITVPAIISERAESHSKLGKLTVLVSALEIYDSCSLLLHRFEKEDVDDIKVHSPYEVSIRQRFIGKPDVAYQLISAKMPEVIPILEVQFSSKIELLEDALVLRNKVFASSAERHAASRSKGCTPHRELPTGGQEGEQLQLQKNLPLFSEGEAQELTQVLGLYMCPSMSDWSFDVACPVGSRVVFSSSVSSAQKVSDLGLGILSKMKGLALDTEAELERQDAALDGITVAVDRATLNVDKQNRRMRKLM